MKIDKMGKFLAKVVFHISFIGVLIVDWEKAGIGSVMFVAIMGMFFFGLYYFTELKE